MLIGIQCSFIRRKSRRICFFQTTEENIVMVIQLIIRQHLASVTSNQLITNINTYNMYNLEGSAAVHVRKASFSTAALHKNIC